MDPDLPHHQQSQTGVGVYQSGEVLKLGMALGSGASQSVSPSCSYEQGPLPIFRQYRGKIYQVIQTLVILLLQSAAYGYIVVHSPVPVLQEHQKLYIYSQTPLSGPGNAGMTRKRRPKALGRQIAVKVAVINSIIKVFSWRIED